MIFELVMDEIDNVIRKKNNNKRLFNKTFSNFRNQCVNIALENQYTISVDKKCPDSDFIFDYTIHSSDPDKKPVNFIFVEQEDLVHTTRLKESQLNGVMKLIINNIRYNNDRVVVIKEDEFIAAPDREEFLKGKI